MRRQALPLLLLALPLLLSFLSAGSVRAEGVTLVNESVDVFEDTGVGPFTLGALARVSEGGRRPDDGFRYIRAPRDTGEDGKGPRIDRPHRGEHEFSGRLDFCGRLTGLHLTGKAAQGATLATNRFFSEYTLPHLRLRDSQYHQLLDAIGLGASDDLPCGLTPSHFRQWDEKDRDDLGGADARSDALRLGFLESSAHEVTGRDLLEALVEEAAPGESWLKTCGIESRLSWDLNDEAEQTRVIALRTRDEAARGLTGRLAVVYRKATCTVVDGRGTVIDENATAYYLRIFGCPVKAATSALLFIGKQAGWSLEGSLREHFEGLQEGSTLEDGQIVLMD